MPFASSCCEVKSHLLFESNDRYVVIKLGLLVTTTLIGIYSALRKLYTIYSVQKVLSYFGCLGAPMFLLIRVTLTSAIS